MPTKPLELIGAAFGWGAKRHETQFGPQALKDFGLISSLQKKDPAICEHFLRPLYSYNDGMELDYAERVTQVQLFTQRLAEQVAKSQETHFPVILGGDHSIAIGTWSAAAMALGAKEEFGLMWIDAHMDSHTPQTTPSHAIHGMPLAVLMGYGEPSLINVYKPGPKLHPKHIVLIGVRSFELGEAELLKRLKVRVYFMDEVKQRGFDVVFREGLSIITEKTKGFGISIDIDGIDPTIAPGTGTPVPDGLSDQDLINALKQISNHSKFKALEIVEFDPTRDPEQKTAKVIQALLMSMRG